MRRPPGSTSTDSPMAESPDVTVVIPTRDRRELLTTAIGVALDQEDVTSEVVVVEDGSKDGTTATVAALGDPRVRLLRQDRPQGPSRARNRGIDVARGEWVAFLDDDDLWSPRKLRLQIDRATSHGASWAYGAAVLLDERGQVVRRLAAPDSEQLVRQLLVQNVIPGGSSNVIVRTELVRSLAGFDENLWHIADWDLWIRLALEAKGVGCREIVVGYLSHSGNMLTADSTGVMGEFEYVAAKHRAAASAAGCKPNRALFLRFIAFGELRAGWRGRAARTYLRGGPGGWRLGNVALALGALLGERAMRAGYRISDHAAPADPRWLAEHRRLRGT
jgi:glycosyltransferase involved in cell wall biosynthesis